jgi:molybdate/tungstate transport system substrate-binding protein
MLLFLGCDRQSDQQELVIFHAGSLSVPFRQLAEVFEQQNPNVTVKMESAGSRACARKVTEIGKMCDILASADYKVINNLLIPEYAEFNIRFAQNEMAIAYTEKSKYTDTINSGNWHEIFLKDDVKIGRSDPDSDPCGYRSLMTMQLAEKYYKHENLYNKLKAKEKYIRPKETDLLALLEIGEIDYIFIYRSVAIQHGLKMLLLDDEINLKSAAMTPLYNTASVKVNGKAVGEFIERIGEPMVYSITIPKNAANKTAAVNFIELLLTEEGVSIFRKNGQPTITPAIAEGFGNLPTELKNICTEFIEGRP